MRSQRRPCRRALHAPGEFAGGVHRAVAAHEVCAQEYAQALLQRLTELEAVLAQLQRLARAGGPDVAARMAHVLGQL